MDLVYSIDTCIKVQPKTDGVTCAEHDFTACRPYPPCYWPAYRAHNCKDRVCHLLTILRADTLQDDKSWGEDYLCDSQSRHNCRWPAVGGRDNAMDTQVVSSKGTGSSG